MTVPHIDLPEGSPPGIAGLLAYRPETAKPLSELAEVLLRDDNSLSRGERELIAAYMSSLNECRFCEASHSSFAALQLDDGMPLVEATKQDPSTAGISDKVRALLRIAGKVQDSGLSVTTADVTAAKEAGATDVEIHDTVLIAAAFCMYNRYVDGLATWAPDDPSMYEEVGRMIVAHGYLAAAPAPGG
jgi:uncharacterized peroxidase-related enzyme